MKKFSIVFLALIALLAFTVSPVLAASGILILREARNDPSGGVIFVFEYTGDFSEADFKGGSAMLNGQYYPLDCNIVEGEGLVQCTASRALAGGLVQVFLAGSIFWDKVPEGGRGGYCYDVYDFPAEGQPAAWTFQGEHCQDEPASQGDMINFYSPFWESYYDYYFEANGLEWLYGDPSTNPGEGYYYEGSES
ncbi:MAG: hypothetical protein IPG44_02690 [Anaerolineales bacterium]|jgi:hypothetical protein|nr:hypothetical protein [Anaerolineales bacterium]